LILQTISPSSQLAPYIKEYWWLENNITTHTELVYPTGEVQILFHYGTPFRKPTPTGTTASQPQMAVCGQNLLPGEVISTHHSGVIGVVFRSHGAHPFLHLPVDQLTNLEVAVADIYKDWKNYENQFVDCRQTIDRIRLIEKFLLKKLMIKNAVHFNIIHSSIMALKQSCGQIPVRQLAKNYYVSERNYTRLFKKHVGLTPKKTADIMRFNHAVSLLNQKKSATMVSYMSGYYDQAHFIKSFKQLMGMTPKAYCKLL